MDQTTDRHPSGASSGGLPEGAEARRRQFGIYTRTAALAGGACAAIYAVNGAYMAATTSALMVVIIEWVRRWVARPGDLSREQIGTHIWVGAAVVTMIVTAAEAGQGAAATISYLGIVPMVLTYLTSIRAGTWWLAVCLAGFAAVHSMPLWLSADQMIATRPVDRLAVQVVMTVAFYMFARTQVVTVHAQERELQAARDKAVAAERAKTEFLARVSHELRTPLHGVVAGMEALTTRAHPGIEDRQLAAVFASADRATRVVDSILELFRLEFSAVTLDKGPVRLAEVLAHAVHVVQPIATQKDLTVTYDVAADAPPYVTGDAIKLREMVLCLAGNAVKYTDEGAVGIEASWRDGIAKIDVWDTGIGIAADMQERIFEPFEQGDGGPTRHYGGTGLGLAITRELAELLDCDLSVSSRVGEGARFTLRLPMPAHRARWAPPLPHPAAIVPDPVYDSTERGPAEGPLVVVVDDHPTNAAVAGDILETLGCRSLWAVDGPAAIEILERRSDIAGVLLDLHLPGMHGTDVARHARGLRGPGLPIVVLTADVGAVDRQPFEADGYLAKPVRLATLSDTLRRAGIIAAPFDLGELERVRDILATGELTDTDIEWATAEISEACGRASAFTERLRGSSDTGLHLRAHRNLVGSLLLAQQLLRADSLTDRSCSFVIDCLNRALRWEDAWAAT